jgi:hypothetical protein
MAKKKPEIALEYLDPNKTIPVLNKIRAEFGSEAYEQFIDYIFEDCITIHENLEKKDQVVYVPNFIFLEFNKEATKSIYKGFALTYGILVGYVTGSKLSYINCGINIAYYKPYETHPDDNMFDEFNRVKKLTVEQIN